MTLTSDTEPEEIARRLFEDVDLEVIRDPYPWYRALREQAPILFRPGWDEWVLTRYADVQAVLRDPASSTDPTNGPLALAGEGDDPIAAMLRTVMLFMDPPDHTRLRALVSRAFTPRSVERLRPRITEIVADLLAAVRDRGAMDVIADFSFPLPVTVICELLGVPAEDRELFRTRTPALAAVLEGILPPDKAEQAALAAMEFAAYLLPLFEQRRAEPRDDLISALVAAEVEGERLTHEEMLTTVILLLGAGHETTMNLVANAMLALIRNPDQLATLRRDPALIPGAVEEFLRYDSPVQLTVRNLTADAEIGGQRMRNGQQAVLLLGAANHDPAIFSEPDALDVTRAEVRHLSFSHGVHYCLGATLARVEAEIALAGLVASLDEPALAVDAPEWRPTRTLRGLKALPIVWGRGGT